MKKVNRKISKLEEKQGLIKTLEYNAEALDYVKNNIYRLENLLKVSPDDLVLQDELGANKYIKFSLDYLEECYCSRLKQIG